MSHASKGDIITLLPGTYTEAVVVELSPEMLQQMTKGQIVNTQQADNAETPDKAKFLGERNQRVAEETRARKVDQFRKENGPGGAGSGRSLGLKSLAPQVSAEPPTKLEREGYRRERAEQQARQQGGDGGSPQAASNDWLKDVQEGDRTMLATREFKYFGYYRRIREKLEVAWGGELRHIFETNVLNGRRLASSRNYVTGVVVVLDRHGRIVGVRVMEQSGARDLDRAAVDAFNRAGPFPDPPGGLVDTDGTIKIPWNFIVSS
ncbi:MAG: TonB family protein [Bdellovibrionales bacterium]|nr:TonB family protein [Bdellovibrionales bacterium]